MRITSRMISKQYQKNLNNSLGLLNYYNNRATTFRKFDKVSENPVAAAQAFRLRKEYIQNDDYQTNLRDTQNLFLTAESSMMSINSMLGEVVSTDCLKAINGTSGSEERKIIAEKLRKMQEAVVASANTKFGDRYIFAGSDAADPPFTTGPSGELLYRGADVTTGKLKNEDGAIINFQNSKISFGKENNSLLNGYNIELKLSNTPIGAPLQIDDANNKIVVNLNEGSTLQDLKDVFTNAGTQTINGSSVDFTKISFSGKLTSSLKSGISQQISDTVDLKELSNEKIFIDLGLGLQFDSDGKINEQSAFNTAIPGIAFLGFGKNENGIPNNVYSLMGKIADELENPNYSFDKIQPYIENLEKQQLNLMTNVTGMGVKSNFLENTKSRLEDSAINLNTKILDVENIDPAQAIMDFKMQEYSYRAALQMGTKILQPTFLDFMS